MHPQDTPDERWLPIPGWEGLYLVSSLARVWGVRKDRTINPSYNQALNRYYIRLCRNGERKSQPRSAVVALAFHGPRPLLHDIDHIDADRTNDRPENLEYVTRRENVLRVFRAGRHTGRGKLTIAEVLFIRSEKGKTPASVLAKRFSVWPSTIHTIQSGVKWGKILPM